MIRRVRVLGPKSQTLKSQFQKKIEIQKKNRATRGQEFRVTILRPKSPTLKFQKISSSKKKNANLGETMRNRFFFLGLLDHFF